MTYGANLQSKESIIQELLQNTNFNDPKLNVKEVKRKLTDLLHEEPGIKIDWINQKAVNEVTGKETQVEKVASVKVYFTATDAEGKLAPKSLTFYVG